MNSVNNLEKRSDLYFSKATEKIKERLIEENSNSKISYQSDIVNIPYFKIITETESKEIFTLLFKIPVLDVTAMDDIMTSFYKHKDKFVSDQAYKYFNFIFILLNHDYLEEATEIISKKKVFLPMASKFYACYLDSSERLKKIPVG